MSLEQQLSRAQQAGKEQIDVVFALVYQEYKQLIWYIANLKLGSKEASEDIMMDVFVAFYEAISKGVKITNIKYYLVSIAHRLGNKETIANAQLTEFDPDYMGATFDENHINLSLFSQEMLNHVTSEEYILLIEKIVYQYSFKEMAKIHRTSLPSIAGKYARALKKVQKGMKS